MNIPVQLYLTLGSFGSLGVLLLGGLALWLRREAGLAGLGIGWPLPADNTGRQGYPTGGVLWGALFAAAVRLAASAVPFWGQALLPLVPVGLLVGAAAMVSAKKGTRMGRWLARLLWLLAVVELVVGVGFAVRFFTAWTPEGYTWGTAYLIPTLSVAAGCALALAAAWLAWPIKDAVHGGNGPAPHSQKASLESLSVALAAVLVLAGGCPAALNPTSGPGWATLAVEVSASLAGLGLVTALVWAELREAPVSFITKLVGVLLVTYLMFFVPGGLALLWSGEGAREEEDRRNSYLAFQSVGEASLAVPYPEVGYVAVWNLGAHRFVYVRDDWAEALAGEVGERLAVEAAEQTVNETVLVQTTEAGGSWPRVARYGSFPTGSLPLFWVYLFESGGRVFEVGFPAEEGRLAVHTQALQVWGLGLMGVVFILFFFPLIFQAALLRPLQELVRGVRELGAWASTAQGPGTRVRPGPPDEFGQLAKAFNEMAAALERRTGEVVEVNRQLQQEMEVRQRLARDLHDSVTQTLYGLTLMARGVREQAEACIDAEPALLEGLSELESEARNALEELRLLLYELRPLALEQDGLAGALERRLLVMEQRGGLHSSLVVGPNVPPLDPQVELELYYLAMEALNNVVKHAAAQHVVVRIEMVEGVLHLVVWDDGRGFDMVQNVQGTGLGLESMQGRAQRLGAALEVRSTPGEGTRVEVISPIF